MPQTQEARTSTSESPSFRKVAECLYRHESSGIYYALVKRSGKQYRRSLKTKDRKLAERHLSGFREKIGHLSKSAGANKVTFQDLGIRWLETLKPTLKPKSYTRRDVSLRQIMPYLGHLTIRNFTSRACDEWAAKRSPGVSASTYNNERDCIIAIMAYAKREGMILDNPAEVLTRRKLPRVQIVIPTQAQFATLIGTLRGLDRRYHDAANLLELLAYSGMRLNEATNLKWSDVKSEVTRFVVTGGEAGTKNHEVREVPLFPAMSAFLTKLKAGITAGDTALVIGISSAKNAIEQGCKRAALPSFTHHSMRHYFVSNAIEKNIDFKVIASWIGHKDGGLLVAKTYGHLRDSHSHEMARLMV